MKISEIHKFFDTLVKERPELLNSEAIIYHAWSSSLGEITGITLDPMENYDVGQLGWGEEPAETDATDIVVFHIAD